MVTVEAAFALPILVLVTVGLVWLVAAAAGQLRCIDAAREAARVAARGDGSSSAVAVARRLAPANASVSVSRGGGEVTASVHAVVTPFGGWAGRLASARLSATYVAADEDQLP
jgi:hypothetical protein